MNSTKFYQQFVFHWRHSVWVTCLVVLLFNVIMFGLSGIFNADLTYMGIDSRAQLAGLVLLVTLIPMWLLGCFFVTQRHSLSLAHQLDALVPDEERIGQVITSFPGRQVGFGLLGGLIYALAFNVPHQQYGGFLRGGWRRLRGLLRRGDVDLGGLLRRGAEVSDALAEPLPELRKPRGAKDHEHDR